MNNVYYNKQNTNMQQIHQQVMDAITLEYYSYTKTERLAYKIGSFTRSLKNFMSTPQASALGLISFWAAFVISYFFLTLAINSFSAYVVFGLIFLIHTHLTFDAVDALVKQALAQNLFRSFNV